MSVREVATVQTYLIHLQDRELALAVGAALESRLTADGREAVALVPASDGLGLTRPESGSRGSPRCARRWGRRCRRSAGSRPLPIASRAPHNRFIRVPAGIWEGPQW